MSEKQQLIRFVSHWSDSGNKLDDPKPETLLTAYLNAPFCYFYAYDQADAETCVARANKCGWKPLDRDMPFIIGFGYVPSKKHWKRSFRGIKLGVYASGRELDYPILRTYGNTKTMYAVAIVEIDSYRTYTKAGIVALSERLQDILIQHSYQEDCRYYCFHTHLCATTKRSIRTIEGEAVMIWDREFEVLAHTVDRSLSGEFIDCSKTNDVELLERYKRLAKNLPEEDGKTINT